MLRTAGCPVLSDYFCAHCGGRRNAFGHPRTTRQAKRLMGDSNRRNRDAWGLNNHPASPIEARLSKLATAEWLRSRMGFGSSIRAVWEVSQESG